MNPLAVIATIKINLLRRPLWEAETVEECLVAILIMNQILARTRQPANFRAKGGGWRLPTRQRGCIALQ